VLLAWARSQVKSFLACLFDFRAWLGLADSADRGLPESAIYRKHSAPRSFPHGRAKLIAEPFPIHVNV
jgi:hypothetical protein